MSSFKSCFNFVDAWWSKHPHMSQCLWFNSNLSISSRLDYFLVTHELINSLSSSEHQFITLDVDLSDVFDFGPGVEI